VTEAISGSQWESRKTPAFRNIDEGALGEYFGVKKLFRKAVVK